MAVVRTVDDKDRIEFPPGKTLYQTKAAALILGRSIESCRIAPTGEQIAFGGAEGLSLVDRIGKTTRLASVGHGEVSNIAWSPRGDEIWF